MALQRSALGAPPIRSLWDRLSPLPGGKRLFSRLVGRAAPYTGSVGGVVQELGPGWCRVTLKDRRGVRNHLRSIHAIALANLGEMCTGLAMMYDFPADGRGIVTRFEVEYLKKARGTLTAEARTPPVTTTEPHTEVVPGEIRDEAGDVVARVTAHWLIGPA